MSVEFSAPDATSALLARLSDLPAAAVLTGDAVGPAHAADATGNLSHRPALVLRPHSTAQLSQMLAACHALRLPVVTQGGRTGLSNGATPAPGEIALSLERMTQMQPVDASSATLICEAGVTLHRVQQAALQAGLSFGIDIGARGTATVGGICATNAGGLNVIRNGMTRAHVLSLQAVLADGRIIGAVNPLAKDNSGYDLKQLFIGSEGTLGVITQVCLALKPPVGVLNTLFGAAPDVDCARALLARLRRDAGGALMAFEIMDEALFARILALGHRAPVAPEGIQLLAEVETRDAEHLQEVLMQAVEAGELSDVTLAASGVQRAALWSLREACAEAVAGMAAPVGFDIGLPGAEMAAFLRDTRAAIATAEPGAQVFVFGHLGDGNLHYIVDTPHPEAVAQVVLSAVAAAGGALSAEHGLGREKAKYLPLVRSADDIALMRAMKAMLDPRGILNPGRVLPPEDHDTFSQ